MSRSATLMMVHLDSAPLKESVVSAMVDWVPIVGILILHLVLGLCVDNWKGGKAGAKIDYVLCGEGATVRAAEIIRTQRDGRFPSDHYPVRAKVVLPGR